MMDYESLTGPEKVAIVVLSLPDDQVRAFLGQLEDDEVEKSMAAVSRMEQVPALVQQLVLQEFQETLGREEEDSIRGGRDEALSLVEAALSPDRAGRILENLGRDEKRIDWTLRAYQPFFIADRISGEHPQTIALILSQIPAERGAAVLEALEPEHRSEVVLRLASLEPVATDVISDLELGVAELFERKLASTTRAGGAAAAASVLNRVSREDGASILDEVDEKDAETALSIRKRMLTFDDLVNIDRRGFQSFLREIATEDLAVALKTAGEEMKEKVFSNLSSRASDQIKEEIELLGPMRIADVEKIQEQIVETARQLESDGRLSIEIGGGNEVLV
jgi:flagellar motor switch protein FliG